MAPHPTTNSSIPSPARAPHPFSRERDGCSGPAVSIVVGIQPGPWPSDTDLRRIHRLIDRAGGYLAAWPADQVQYILERLRALAVHPASQPTGQGLELTVGPGIATVTSLRHPRADRVILHASPPSPLSASKGFDLEDHLVLVLSEHVVRLYQAAHDSLFEVRDSCFPLPAPPRWPSPARREGVRARSRQARRRGLFAQADQALARYTQVRPRSLVLVGAGRHLGLFRNLMRDPDTVIAEVRGSHARTAPEVLAKLVSRRLMSTPGGHPH